MIRIRVFLLLLSLVTVATAKDKREKANELFERAEQVNRFSNDSVPSYHQEVEFNIKAPGQPEVPGKFFREVLDHEHFRRRIVASTYDGVFVRKGQRVFTKASSSPKPVIISTIESVIPPLFVPMGQQVARVFSASFGGAALQCIEFKESLEKFCFDADAKLIRYESHSGVVTFSAFHPFGDHQLPERFELLANDGTSVMGNLKTMVSKDLKVELFEPPASAGFKEETRPTCKITTAPFIRHTTDPDFPEGGLQGVVVLSMTLGANGIPSDIQIVRSLTPANDREAVKAVTRWRFSPAACDGIPITTPLTVEVNFRKY